MWACVSEVTLSYFFVRMQILSHSRNTHTVYNAYTYTHTVTRAYCKLQKLLPLAKLISKYASWHLMPSVTEIRAKDPAGGLKFSFLADIPPFFLLLLSLVGGPSVNMARAQHKRLLSLPTLDQRRLRTQLQASKQAPLVEVQCRYAPSAKSTLIQCWQAQQPYAGRAPCLRTFTRMY